MKPHHYVAGIPVGGACVPDGAQDPGTG